MLPVQDPLERTKDVWEEMPVQSKRILNGTIDYGIINIDTNLSITSLYSTSFVVPNAA